MDVESTPTLRQVSSHLSCFSISSNKMASLAILIVGAGIKALAFSESNYLFSKISNHGEAERKRHNLAMEKFQKDRDEWNKETS